MRCVIVDDSEAFLKAACDLLAREGIDVVGVATTIGEALGTIAACCPEVTLVDIDLEDESGLDLVSALVEAEGRDVPDVILISAHAELDFADLIAASPAAGFIPKPELSAGAIREVLSSQAGSGA